MEENYQCEFCKRFFKSAPALWSHTGKCKSNPAATNAELTEKQKQRAVSNKGKFFLKKEQCFCEFCNREFNYKFALTNHLKTCKQNPNRDEAYCKYISEVQKRAVTKEKREAASKRTVFNNFWKYRAKNPIVYESAIAGIMKLDSNWELLVAKRLDELQVEWYRPKIGLPYFDIDGVQHHYFPDFYCKTYNCFLEVKSEFIKNYQNSSNKVDYVKRHYPFVKWLETEDACKTFELADLECSFIPEKDEEDIAFWLKQAEIQKKEKAEEAFRREENKKLKLQQKEQAEIQKKEKEEKLFRREQNKKLKLQQKEQAEIQRRTKYKELIESSNIDFSKFGWVGQLSKLLNVSPKYIRSHIPRMFPEIEFFTRNGENSNAHKHWWTNGIDEVSAISCPDGWWKGRSSQNS